MATNSEDISWLYGKLKARGYDIGSEQEFTRSLANEQDRRWYYDKASSMGLQLGSMDDFNSLFAPRSAAEAARPEQNGTGNEGRGTRAATLAPATQAQAAAATGAAEAARPEQNEAATAAANEATTASFDPDAHLRVADSFRTNTAGAVESVQRLAERGTQAGRDRLRAAKSGARLAGAPTRVLGLSAGGAGEAALPEQNGGGEETQGYQSRERVVPYGIHYVDGKPVTEWLLPDGRTTTDLTEADAAEHAAAGARLNDEFEKRMRKNHLLPGSSDHRRRQAILDRMEANRRNLRGKEAEIAENAARDWEWDENSGFFDNLGRLAANSMMSSDGVQHGSAIQEEGDADFHNLIAEHNMLAKAKERDDAGRLRKSRGALGGLFDVANNFRNIGRGMGDVASDANLYIGGLGEYHDAERLDIIKDKVERGQELSDSEYALAYAAMLRQDVEANTEVPHGYTAGSTTMEMLPFMLEMAANPASGLSKGLARKFGSTAVKRIALRVGGDIAESAVLANTLQAPATIADIRDRHRGDVAIDGGKVSFEGGESLGAAIAKGQGAAVIENYTELLGSHFGAIGGAVGRGAKRVAAKAGMGKVVSSVSKMANNVKATDWYKAISNIEQRAQWNGTVGEVLEEEAGIVLNSVFVGDNKLSDLTDAEQQVDIVLGVGLFGGFVSGIKTAGYPVGRARAKHKLQRADTRGNAEFGKDSWTQIRGIIDTAEDENLSQAVTDAANRYGETQAQQKLILEYAKALVRSRGYNLADAARRSDPEAGANPRQELAGELYSAGQDAYERWAAGYPGALAEVDEAAQRMREAYATVEEAFGGEAEVYLAQAEVNPWPLFDEPLTEEQHSALLNYVNCRAAVDGVNDATGEALADKRVQVEADVNRRMHKDRYAIIPVRMKVGDAPVYIVKGKVAMFADGSGVDARNSSESVIVLDETGNYRFVAPEQIASVGESLDPAQEIEAAYAEIAREHLSETGVFDIDAGSVLAVELPDMDGTMRAHEVRVEGIDSNGDYMVRYHGMLCRFTPEGLFNAMTASCKAQLLAEARGAAVEATQPSSADEAAGQDLAAEAAKPEQKLPGAAAGGAEGPEAAGGEQAAGGIPAAEAAEQGQINGEGGGQTGAFSEAGEAAPASGAELPAGAPAGTEQVTAQEAAGAEEPEGAIAPGVQPEGGQPQTEERALARIPVNEQGEPAFEAVDAETGWDGLVEAVGGEADAEAIARAQVRQASAELEALGKRVPKPKEPKLTGSPMAMARAQREATERYNSELAAHNERVAAAQARMDAWKGIVGVRESRLIEENRREEEERRRRDAAAHDEAAARFEEQQRLKAEREAEQERVGTHAVKPRIKEKWDAAPKIEGNADVITLPDGSTLSGRYVLVEAGAATASHDAGNGFVPTEGFPVDENGQSVNDRDYQRDADAQRIVAGMADNYDNRALQDPVVVSQDGVVLSGNNRTMSGDLAASRGTDRAYVDYLAQFGHRKYGFRAEQVAGMQHPRVLFVPDEALPYDATTFARFNAQEKKSQSKPEAAVKLGKTVPDNVFAGIVETISRYERLSDFYADERAVAQTLGMLMQAGVINERQLPEFRTGTALSAAGRELIENMLIGKAFQASPDAVRQIIAVPTLRQAVVMALNEIAGNRTLAESGYDLSAELARAVDLVARAKAADPEVYTAGMPVSPFGRQQGLFDDEFGDSRVSDATTLLLADTLNSAKPSDLRKVLATYNESARQAAEGQIDMFSDTVPAKEEILTKVIEHFRNATPKEQQALVEAAILRRREAASRSAERKRRAEAGASEREREDTAEQTADAAGGRGEGAGAAEPSGAEALSAAEAARPEQKGTGNEERGTRGAAEAARPEQKGVEATGNNAIKLISPLEMTQDEKRQRAELLRKARAIEVEPEQIVADGSTTARQAAEAWWDANVGEPALYDTEVGEVEINRNSIESSLAHRYGQRKLDAITSLIEGFENAVYLGTLPDSTRQEGVNNHYFAYPIIYKGERCYVFCRAMQDANKNRLYVHEVFVEDKIIKSDTLQTAASQPHGGIALYRDLLANILEADISEGKGNALSADKQGEEAESSKPYTITATTYTNKKGKTSDDFLVKFKRELTDEEKAALDTFIREPFAEGKKTSRGWYDRKQGGYMMRSEEAARQLGELIAGADESARQGQINEAIADLQPMSAEELREASADAATEEKPARKPAKPKKAPVNRVNLEGLTEELRTTGEAKLSDHAEQVDAEAQHEISDEEMQSLADELRDLLDIGDDEGDGNIKFRDPGELTPQERQRIQSAGIRLAMGLVERGTTAFPDYATKMVGLLGDKIRPWLKSFYEGARWTPGYDKYSFTPSDEVARFDVQNFDKKQADPIAQAAMIVEERKAGAVSAQAQKELTETRNTNRRENDKQTEADTAAIAGKAEAVAGEAERVAASSTDSGELSAAAERIDETLDEVNDQLAILGYFDGTGQSRDTNAEKKAAQSGATLAARLVEDLGLDSGNLPKDVQVVKADFGEHGGFVRINLPVRSGYEPLRIDIRFERTEQEALRLVELMSTLKRGDAQSPIIGEDHKVWLMAPKYGELLRTLKEQIKKYLPQTEEQAYANAVSVLKGGKKPSKKRTEVKPEQPVADLFGGLFDEPISDEKKIDVQARSGAAERERGHEPQSHEPMGKSQRDEAEGTDGRGMGGRGSVNPMPDGKRGTGVSRKSESQPVAEPLPEAERKNVRNNHGERGVDYAPKGEDARIKANIEAIELAKQLLESGESATPEQMTILRRFSGWGGLGKAFNEQGYGLNPIAKRLRELLGEQGYQDAVDSRRSAYYTPAEVIDAMWDVARALGFKGGNVLEGSAGIGNILGQMPADMSARSSIHAVEIDSTTGGILSLLYPDAKVEIQGFEKTRVQNGSVDLAITNVPFITGAKVFDETGDKDLSRRFGDIHDFCIAKNIRKLREGGIGIFITSSGTLDNSKALRNWISSEGNADVVGAFRMHNQTFGGTGATSDIIVVRKRVNGKPSVNAIDIADVTGVRVAEYDTGETRKVKGREVAVVKQYSMTYNKYFAEHPENMAGEMMFNFERRETRFPTSRALFPAAGKDQSKMLAEWAAGFADMKEESATTPRVEDEVTRVNERLGEGVKEGSMVLNSEGQLCMARMGEAEPIMSPQADKGKPQKTDAERLSQFQNKKVKGHTKAECFKAYTAIKTALANLLEYQTNHESDEGLAPLQKELNRAFDAFTGTYGNFHKNPAISFLRNDVDFPSIVALETYSEKGDKNGHKVVTVGKTDIFSRRVVEMEKEPQPTTLQDAILASLYKNGGIDLEYIAEALKRGGEAEAGGSSLAAEAGKPGQKRAEEQKAELKLRAGQISGRGDSSAAETAGPEQKGKTIEELKREIVKSGLGFENPATGAMEVSYKYLSGNVREKLHIARENNTDGRYDANIRALEGVLPMTIPSHLIEFSLGSSWIEPKLYEDFIYAKTGLRVKLTNAGGTWFMKAPWATFNEKNRAMAVESKMCGKVVMGHELIEAAITNKQITVSKSVKHSDGTSETITDRGATAECGAKVDEIRADFKDWAREQMQADAAMSARIEQTYNDQFNNYVPMSIPDEFVPQHFGGQVSELHGRVFALRPHQGRAVVRGTTEPILLAHEVGTGKTYTLITTAMEMRRLGTARKPMIVVQNATVGQFVESAKEIYPNAKVLTIEEADRTAEGRKNFYAKIKYNDWDMIVVPQSVFERIPDNEEREMAYVKDIIEEKMKVLDAMREADAEGRSIIVRQAERELAEQETRLTKLTEAIEGKKKARDEKRAATTRHNAEVRALEMLDREVDDVENFDDMGIDALLVDEAHEYKHLGFATAMQRGVKGVDPSPSKKSQGVFLKAQSVMERNNGRNVVFATGTPISNTAAEIWTFMRYLMPADTMKSYGIYYFDDFVRNFGNIAQMVEFSTNGKFKENNRFAGYVNLPELVRIWSGVADTVLTREAGGVSDKIPDMEGGKPQDIYQPQTRALRSVMKYVKAELDRYDKMTGKEKKENSHIPLTMYGIAKAAAIDVRLVVPNAEDDPNSKTNATVRETLRSLRDSAKYKGTVAIFSDNYQNKQSGFNLYEDIRRKLIAEGVPAEEIVVIKSGMTVKKKLEIFEKVNSGEIRVIMGSTFTLGTGVNIQERLHTLIHVDAPNRPMDYTQRNGRALRQGNLHRDMGIPVRIIRFGVEDSLDVTAYQRLKTKGAIADSIMNGSKLMQNSMENRVVEEEEGPFGGMTAQLSGSEYAILKNQAEREVRKLTAQQKSHELDQIYVHNQLPKVEGLIKGAERRIEIESKNLETIGRHFPSGTIMKISVGKLTYDSVGAMEDFFKEQNAKMNEAAENIREGAANYVSKLSIDVDGLKFEVTTTVSRIVDNNGQGKLTFEPERNVRYSCEELGIKDKEVKGNRLKNVMQKIEEDIATGKESRELLSRGQQQLEHYTEERSQLAQRAGRESPYIQQLAEAKERLAQYEEAMKEELAEKEAKYAELDKTVEAATDVSLTDEDSEEGETSGEGVRYRLVADGELLDFLDGQPLKKGYRYSQWANMGVLPPMTAKQNGEWRAPMVFNRWEQSEEGMRKENGKADLVQGNGRTTGDVAYNPYFHIRTSPLNDQFTAAYDRPELLVVEGYYPESEETSGYHAEGAKDSVGLMDWHSGSVNGQLSDETKVQTMLSRYFKPARIVPWSEVADLIIERVGNQNIAFPINAVPPMLRAELAKRGAKFGDISGNVPAEDVPMHNDLRDRVNAGEWDAGLEEARAYLDAYESSNEAKEARVGELSEKTHVRVRVIRTQAEIDALPTRRQRRAKGWFSERDNEIVIVLPNNVNVADVDNTFIHEVVGHRGLRALIGGERFDAFLDEVYGHASNPIRRTIDGKTDEMVNAEADRLRVRKAQAHERAGEDANAFYYTDMAEARVEAEARREEFRREATEEYMADLGGRIGSEGFEKMSRDELTLWGKIKAKVQAFLDKFLRGLNIPRSISLTDKDLSYILYKSWKNLRDSRGQGGVFADAEDAVMRRRTGWDEAMQSEDEGEVRFRDGEDYVERTPVMARAMYEEQIRSNMHQITEAMQDSMRGLLEFYRAVESQGAKRDIEDVASFENAYLAENAMSSKSYAEAEEYEKRIMRPLLDIAARMAKNKRGQQELTNYMMAKHGLERNAYMRADAQAKGEDTERDFAGLCGLTGEADWRDAEAVADLMVQNYEAAHSSDIADLWAAVNLATKTSLKKVYDSGLLSKEQYEKIRDMYDYYIPLRGFDEKTSDDVYGYLMSKDGFFSSPIRTAKGRSTKADDPLATIAYMAQNSIIQGNRNMMKQKFLTYVQNHPSDLASVSPLWLVHDEVNDEWKPVFADIDESMSPDEIEREIADFEQRMEALAQAEPDKYKRGREAAGIPYRVTNGNIKEHQIVVKRNGISYVITINGNPRAAQAVNGLTNPDNDLNGAIGKVFNAAAAVNRQLSQFYTTRNPDFVISNFIRDLIYSNVMVHVKESQAYAMRFHKNHARVNPLRMMKLLRLYANDKLDMRNPLHRMFYEFMHWGGETGYTLQRDLDQEKQLVAEIVKDARRGKLNAIRLLHLVGAWLDRLNRGVENSARFAAYITSREMGRDVQRSVYDAKEISVNFNKKGAGSKFMDATGQTAAGKAASFISGLGRSFYVFWNAAVQGTANYGKAFRKHPVKAIAITSALLLLGYVLAAMNDDDDDEDENGYFNVPKYIRRSNLMFNIGEQWTTIPLPVEFRAIYGLGELAYSVTSEREEYSDAELAREMSAQLSQVLPLDFLEGGGGLHAFVPSAFKPLVETATNTSWTGLPIYKDTPFNKDMPEWTKAYPRANAQLVDLSRLANEASGGNEYLSGWADFNPAQLEYLLNGYFGGYSHVVDKMVKTGETMLGEREYDPSSILLVNRLVKMGDERTADRKVNSDFHNYLEEYRRTHTLLRRYEEEADRGSDRYRIFLDALRHSRDGARHDLMDEYISEYNWLRNATRDQDIPEEERAEYEGELQALKRQVVSLMKVAHDSTQVNNLRERFAQEAVQQ